MSKGGDASFCRWICRLWVSRGREVRGPHGWLSRGCHGATHAGREALAMEISALEIVTTFATSPDSHISLHLCRSSLEH